METFDIKKDRKDLYSPPRGAFVIVEVPAMNYLMVDGHGDPNTSVAYREALEALYSLSYTARFAAKAQFGRAHVVGPLEGLWWADDPAVFTSRAKDAWSWTMMIHQPDWISPALIEESRVAAARKKPLPGLDRVRFEQYEEGPSAQTLHLGSYDDEGSVLAQLHDEYLPAHGLVMRGKHHEIYLSDARTVAPAKLKTVLRQPVAPASAPSDTAGAAAPAGSATATTGGG